MPKKSIPEASSELYNLLEPFTSDDRKRIIRGTLALLGEQDSASDDGFEGADNDKNGIRGRGTDARTFFSEKTPTTKSEELATAARFLETKESVSAIKKPQFQGVFNQARRNFDTLHFSRDIDNACRGGFFNKGGNAKRGYTLSYYGQNYIDALPDRDAAKKIAPRPSKKKRRKTGA